MSAHGGSRGKELSGDVRICGYLIFEIAISAALTSA